MSTPIVIADDSPVVLRTLSMILSREGYDITTAVDGESALDAVSTSGARLVFVDATMPKLDGYEVCRRLRAGEADGAPRVHVIMLTGSGDEHDRERAAAAGIDEFMTKPFSPSLVLERVRGLLA